MMMRSVGSTRRTPRDLHGTIYVGLVRARQGAMATLDLRGKAADCERGHPG
jgi:hypothetical protein